MIGGQPGGPRDWLDAGKLASRLDAFAAAHRGLAPVVVRRIYGVLPTIVAEGTTALIVEQDVTQAMQVADHVHCLLEGRSVLTGRPSDLSAAQVERAYFGIDAPTGVS